MHRFATHSTESDQHPAVRAAKRPPSGERSKGVMADRIGLFLRSADNAYQRRLKEVAMQEANRFGFELDVQSAQFDSSAQITQIRDAIKNAPNTRLVAVLVSGVYDRDLAPVAHEVAEAGLDWVLLNEGSFIDEVRRQHPERAVFAATCDQAEIGQVHARQVRSMLGKGGRVLCVTGHVQNVAAQLRLVGLKQGLEDEYQLTEINADWTSEGARRAVEAWAGSVTSRRQLPHVVVAQNDEMALGIRQALRDLDSRRRWPIASVPIVGCDGADRFGQRLVREGRLKATVVMPPGTGVAIEWIARLRRGGDKPPVRLILPVTSFPNISRLRH